MRSKDPWTGNCGIIGSLVWVPPKFTEANGTKGIPAIDATGPDGRRWFVTLESPHGGKTSRDSYVHRMRQLANTLLAEADRMEANPNR
jgi:hypothetical protein